MSDTMSKRRAALLCTAAMPLALGAVGALGGCDRSLDEGRPPEQHAPGQEVVKTTVDYGLALRTAAIKLTGNLPTLAEIRDVAMVPADAQAAAYEKQIDAYMAGPRFPMQQLVFWRNTFKLGGGAKMDGAPAFAAMLVVSGRPLTDLVTASSGTCATVEMGGFKAADCKNGAPAVGVLTDPGVLTQFFGPMAFRRTRWVQETFLCSKFPAEAGGRSDTYPSGIYTSPWEMNSISGKKTDDKARVDFHETQKGELCANCHATLNHVAPLLAVFDGEGAFKGVQGGVFPVITPVPGSPASRLQDWLPAGESTAWRYGQKTPDVKALGAAIAADPGFGRCMATRVWNWALSRGDVIVDGSTLTPELADELAGALKDANWDARKLLRRVLLSDGFTRY
jgi:hypothetical protein